MLMGLTCKPERETTETDMAPQKVTEMLYFTHLLKGPQNLTWGISPRQESEVTINMVLHYCAVCDIANNLFELNTNNTYTDRNEIN